MAYNTLQSQSFTRVALSSTKRMRTVVTTSAELYDKTRTLTRINSRKVINVPKQRISQSFSTTKDVFLQLIQMLYRRTLAASPCFPPGSLPEIKKSRNVFVATSVAWSGVTTLRRITYVARSHFTYYRTPCLVCVQTNGSKGKKTRQTLVWTVKFTVLILTQFWKQLREWQKHKTYLIFDDQNLL